MVTSVRALLRFAHSLGRLGRPCAMIIAEREAVTRVSKAGGPWTRPPQAASLLDRATQDQQAIEAAMRWVPLADGRSRRVSTAATATRCY